MIRSIRAVTMVVALLISGFSFVPAAQAQQALCFPSNPMIRECISSFRYYWEMNGGLSIFGYPISGEQSERNQDTGRTHTVQWFERNRFEAHPENPAPYDVLLGRLGADRLAQMGRDWRKEGRERGPKDGCLWFEQTGHNVCDQAPGGATAADRGFKSYWETEQLAEPNLTAYERSLQLHGLPLTAARMEKNSSGHTVLTQWFERGRFEWHPNNPPGARVLLGLLGNEMRGSPAKQTIKFFWPMVFPGGMRPLREGSFASDTMWMVHFAPRNSTKPALTISGGAAGGAPGSKLRDVTVRNQKGTLFGTGSGYVVLWSEDGQVYSITGGEYREILNIAEGLVVTDRATWEQRLRDSSAPQAPQGLQYLWPRTGLHRLSVWPEDSYADEDAFELHLAVPHSGRPDATIRGGDAVDRPGDRSREVTVRGVRGRAYELGAGYSVIWTEDGEEYQVGARLPLEDTLALAEDLEAIDLETFQERLDSE